MKKLVASLAVFALVGLGNESRADWWFWRSAHQTMGPTYRLPTGYYGGADFYYDYLPYPIATPWWVDANEMQAPRNWTGSMYTPGVLKPDVKPMKKKGEEEITTPSKDSSRKSKAKSDYYKSEKTPGEKSPGDKAPEKTETKPEAKKKPVDIVDEN